jgi:hypothetical protein
MDKVAYCAPGLEILARRTLIEHGADVDEVTAEIIQHPWLGHRDCLGTVIVADKAAFELPPFEIGAFRVAPPFDYGLLASRPQPLVIVTGV